MAAKTRSAVPLPSKQEIIDFIEQTPGRVGKREIARAFGLRGADKIWLKRTLKELEAEGTLERDRGRRLKPAGALPDVTVIEVVGHDPDGELLARPLSWRGEDEPPRIYLTPGRYKGPALGVGDRVLARLSANADGTYDARVMRRVEAAPDRVLGVYYAVGADGRIQPTERRGAREMIVRREHAAGARSGDLVLAEPLRGRPLGLREARVIERLGELDSPRTLSLIAIHTHGIPFDFPADALAEAAAVKAARIGRRTDLRQLPLVTIDPEDARDHDDAVWAAADDDPDNRGGWRIIVAIADVGYYVRPDGAIDREALKRGNSVYFPDRMVPMLPERLAADLCSLKPGKSRPVVAVRMRITAEGELIEHRFFRAMIRSVAHLTYRQTQAAADGNPDKATTPLMDTVIAPLYGAYDALAAARERRGPLEIEIAERRVELDAEGHIRSIAPRERLASHRLIEEFMITANVAAARTLVSRRAPCVFRVHEEPPPDKVVALRDFLESLNIKLARGQVIRPAAFNRVLARVADTPHRELVNQVVLRTQTQAYYSPLNEGHFGLNLSQYAHFTSPIRRYSDLLVHRFLIGALGLGEGGATKAEEARLETIAEQISMCERRAMAAEREALDRYLTAFMADKVGATFDGRISGVTRFGLFVTLNETGADGLVPIRSLGPEYWRHDDHRHALIGEETGRMYRLADRVTVRLVEAAPVTGGLVFEIIRDEGREAPSGRGKAGGKPGARAKAGKRRRRTSGPRR